MNTSWQKLAKLYNLTFIPDQFPDTRERVVGEFQGYHLQLSHWTFGIEIILTAPQEDSLPENQLSFDKSVIPQLLNSQLLDPRLFARAQGIIRAENDGQKLLYHQTGIFDGSKNEVEQLQYLFTLLSRLATDYRIFLRWGGEAILAIQDQGKKLNPLARQLIHNIGEETARRLGDRFPLLLCSNCLVRCLRHKVDVPDLLENKAIIFYGCRNCGQSWDFIECQEVVAVLDNTLKTEQHLQAGVLRVNWSVRRRLFDFDSVEIVSATDEEVERFAVQVGNNTDPVQTLTYRRMICTITPYCRLSKNSQRILARIFGDVSQIK